MANSQKCCDCNKSYIYIILSVFFIYFNNIINGLNYNDSCKKITLIKTLNFAKHSFIHQIFCYLGTMIISFVLYNYQTKKLESIFKIEKKETQEVKLNNQEIKLIYNSLKNNNINAHVSYIYFLLFLFFWIIEEESIPFFMGILKDLDFWMIEILIITYLNHKIFNVQVYKHHLIVIIYNLIPIIFKIIAITLSFYDEKNNSNIDIEEEKYKYYDNDDDGKRKLKTLYVVHKWLTPFGIIIYLIFITLRSIINSTIKYFMDLKYFSTFKLLFFYGSMGTIINLIICIISTFIKCKDTSTINIYDYICSVKRYNSNETYFENFLIYFSSNSYYNKEKGEEPVKILLEIIKVILDVITFFLHKYYTLLIIKHLTPVYVIFSFPIHYFFKKTTNLIYDLIDFKNPFIKFPIEYIEYKFCLDLSGDIFSILGFLAYLEIIELKCCGFNYNYRKNIIQRGFNESIQMQSYPMIKNEEENEDDD